MKVTVNNKGIVSVEFEQPTPERVRELINEVKAKYHIKNLREVAKLFGLKPDSGKRSIVGWCADESKSVHLKIPQHNFELLLLIASGAVSIESKAKPKAVKVTRQVILDEVCKRFDINPDYIGLERTEGEYYWTGKVAAILTGTCTYIAKLNDITLSDWLTLLESELRDAELLGEDINARIESIIWEFD